MLKNKEKTELIFYQSSVKTPKRRLNPINKYYNFVTQMFADNRENIKNWGVDFDILEEYIAKKSPINAGLEGRITILK